jgi:predicted nucleic-acid-binding protein
VQHGLFSLGNLWTPRIEIAYVLSEVDRYYLCKTHPTEDINAFVLLNSNTRETEESKLKVLIALIYPTQKWPLEKLKSVVEEILLDLKGKNIDLYVKDHPRSKNEWLHELISAETKINVISKQLPFKELLKKESPDIIYSFGSTVLLEASEYGSLAVNIRSEFDDDLLLPNKDSIISYKSNEYYNLLNKIQK